MMGLWYYIIESTLYQGGKGSTKMATDRVILNIQLLRPQADLLEKIARMRTGQTDPALSVDLGRYIFDLLNRDISSCIREIHARRGG